MALDTYANLKTTVLGFSDRLGVDDAAVPDWVTLGEARLNREIPAVETDATLTGTLDSRRIDITALSMVKPIGLWLAETGNDEREVKQKADGTFPYVTTSGRPRWYAVQGTNIDFDCPLSGAYPFRIHFRQRFALSDAAPTNWLLTNHPDVYLAAVMMWGAGYNEDWPNGAIWKATLSEGIASVKNIIAQNKRAVLTPDPALRSRGGSLSYNQWLNT